MPECACTCGLFCQALSVVSRVCAQVDTMIVQAIGLLDDLDKELNTYAMRVREWFGWHFPEMTKIVSDNIAYAKVVRRPQTSEHAVSMLL